MIPPSKPAEIGSPCPWNRRSGRIQRAPVTPSGTPRELVSLPHENRSGSGSGSVVSRIASTPPDSEGQDPAAAGSTFLNVYGNKYI